MPLTFKLASFFIAELPYSSTSHGALKTALSLGPANFGVPLPGMGEAFHDAGVDTMSQLQVGDFTCQFCGKVYVQRWQLKKHMMLHTGEKPYKCNICHKAYAEKRSINIHMRTHTGEKPFKCDVCGRAFSDKSNLRVHRKIFHENV